MKRGKRKNTNVVCCSRMRWWSRKSRSCPNGMSSSTRRGVPRNTTPMSDNTCACRNECMRWPSCTNASYCSSSFCAIQLRHKRYKKILLQSNQFVNNSNFSTHVGQRFDGDQPSWGTRVLQRCLMNRAKLAFPKHGAKREAGGVDF